MVLSLFWPAGCELWTQDPVRAMKTSWQESKLFVCSFLMGQHKADRSSELPQGHQSPRGQVSPVNWLGDSQAAIKQATASLRGEGGLMEALAATNPSLTSLAFHLPFFHEAQLFRNFREKREEKMSRTNHWAWLDSENCGSSLSSALYGLSSLTPIISSPFSPSAK